MLKLDYTLNSPEERLELVNRLIDENPDLNDSYLEVLADYLIVPIERAERREHKILTNNRMATVNKRETSYEGLVSQLENGEDGIYNLIDDDTRGKSTIFQPKVMITKKDLEEIPMLRQVKDSIAFWESKMKTAIGKDAYVIKKAIIDLRKDQYTIKNSYRKPIVFNKTASTKSIRRIDDSFTIDEEGFVVPIGASFCDPNVCSLILCNYSKLKEDSWGNFESDLYFLMKDFDNLCEKALKNNQVYERIVLDKIDGMQNIDIQLDLQNTFGVKHSLEYISSLWRKKIPNLLASVAEDELLDWYYMVVEKGTYKRCSRCGQIKLACNKYFSKNKTSKDGFYSICKTCRNKKK